MLIDRIVETDHHGVTRVSFIATCPNGHMPCLTYPVVDLKAHLERDVLPMYCMACDREWKASDVELGNLRKTLPEILASRGL